MSIAPGTRFDHYEILALLGKGGMGEVFRALDTRLNREVAPKVLPTEFAQDADRLRRFEVEAKATSALNHPNILTVHDFGVHEGAPYIVAELLTGEELRAQLDNGAVPLRKAIELAQQIASGLAAAHEKNIVHRDLKPENLFITKDGRIKILDFGLAKLTQLRIADFRMRNEDADTLVQSPDGNPQSPIPNPQLTAPGTVMGTVAYMSPEQVQGKDLDHRSDIFSFGIILFEMLSGQRTFTGESHVEVMHAILKADPPELTNSKIPTALDKIVRRCLEKKPEMRFQTASDLGFALSTLTTPSGSRLETATALPALTETLPTKWFGNARLWMVVAAGAALVALAALPFAVKYLRQPLSEAQVTRFSINLPKETSTVGGEVPTPALSPDGRRLVFSGVDAAGKRQLWLRPLDSFSNQPLSGTDGASQPFWSPDGRYIAFFADNKLKKLDTGSGVIETICPAGQGSGGGWNRDGVILFGNGAGAGVVRVNAAGGTPEPVTALDAAHGEAIHNFPSFLPDGKHYLFHIRGRDNNGIYVGSLDSRDRKLLISLGSDSANTTRAVYALPGYILYVLNRSTLLARAFDPDRLELQGEPFRVAENVFVNNNGNARFTVSAHGVLAFIPGGLTDVQLTWCDRHGKRLGVTGAAAPWTNFRLSPDERFVALSRDEPSRRYSIWLLDLAQGATTRFITEGGNLFPVWSPDGQQLAFGSTRNSPSNLYRKPLAGNVQEERLLESPFQSLPTSWSPDGKFLIFWLIATETQGDVWLLPMMGTRKPQPLLQTKANEQNGRVSPDGNWLAYQSDEPGSNEIYVTQFPQPARSWRISKSGGVNPFWRGDSKELYFVSGNKLMAVSVTLGAEVQSGPPQPLFEIEGTNYAPSKDGQRFLVPVVTEKAPTPPINVVLNWAADLKK